MTLSLINDAKVGSPRAENAIFLAKAAELAYLSADTGPAGFKQELSLSATFFSADNTQVYLCHNDDHIVVVFRGSQSPTSIDGLKDWLLTNAVNLLVLPEGRIGTDFAAAGVGAKFHRGFMNALAEIWEPLFPELEAQMRAKERPLWVAGHSLGGAIALLAAWRFERAFLQVRQVFTYGAPMIGNAAAIEAINRTFAGRIFRYVNARDLVPRLPTVSLLANDYAHCQCEIELGSETVGGAATTLENLAATDASAAESVESKGLSSLVQDKLWALVLERLGAHDIANYATLIGR